MAINFLHNLDLSKNELQNAALHPLTANPTSPSTGQFYFNTSNDVIRIYNGTSWVEFSSISLATDTTQGTVKLFSNTDQTVGANTVSTVAGRTYGVQLNGSDQMVVNVPWTDTNTALTTFQVEDGDGTEVTISHQKEWKFVEGAGTGASIDINWTDVSNGTDADPYDLTFTVTNTDRGSSQNIFKTFTVTDTDSGFTWAETGSVVADSNSDTLTFVSGANVDIDVDPATDAIRISATDTNTQLSDEQVQDIVGTQIVTNGTHDGISVTYDDGTDGGLNFTNTDKGSAQNIFKNFAVSGQSTVVADNNNDTLTLVAGTNVTITTNATSDAITINASDTNTDTLQTIAADSANADRFITSVANASGAQTGLSHANLKYNPSTETLKVNNLIVSGTSTTVNTETINLADNIITLNSNASGAATEDAGLEIERGTDTNVQLLWDEGTNRWTFTNNGSTFYNIPISTEYNNYIHPTHPGDDINIDTGALTGATVISDLDFNVTTDGLGHVTDANATIATRALTLGDLGYTGATNADNYGGWNLKLDGTNTTGGASVASGETVDFLSTTAENGGITITNPSANQLEFNVVQGTTTKRGALELATSAETITGTDTARAVTPDGLAATKVTSVITIASLTGTGKAAINHALGTEDVSVELYDQDGYTVYAVVERGDLTGANITNWVTIEFNQVPAGITTVDAIIHSHRGATTKTAQYSV